MKHSKRYFQLSSLALLALVLVSTGLPGSPTVLGDYTVYAKYASQTMSGPGYYLPGVQWVQYFYQGYALHGTYWHNNAAGALNLLDAMKMAKVGKIVFRGRDKELKKK